MIKVSPFKNMNTNIADIHYNMNNKNKKQQYSLNLTNTVLEKDNIPI